MAEKDPGDGWVSVTAAAELAGVSRQAMHRRLDQLEAEYPGLMQRRGRTKWVNINVLSRVVLGPGERVRDPSIDDAFHRMSKRIDKLEALMAERDAEMARLWGLVEAQKGLWN